jgi:hypothetical protein
VLNKVLQVRSPDLNLPITCEIHAGIDDMLSLAGTSECTAVAAARYFKPIPCPYRNKYSQFLAELQRAMELQRHFII